MTEKITVQKTGKSKYGFYLLKDDKTFAGCTEAVSNFVKEKLPGVLEILEKETNDKGHETITKVKVIGQAETKKGGNPALDPDVRLNVDAGNCVQRAVELVSAGKGKDVMSATLEITAAFRAAKQELKKGDLGDE